MGQDVTTSVYHNNSTCSVNGISSSAKSDDSGSIGGLAGSFCKDGNDGNSNDISMLNSYATGNTAGNEDVGGLVGSFGEGYISCDNEIANCFSTGSVTGSGTESEGLGGLIGENLGGNAYNCYAAGKVNGLSDSEAVGGLEGINCASNGVVNYCYTADSSHNILGSGDNNPLNCKSMNLTDMQTQAFVNTLNSNFTDFYTFGWNLWVQNEGENNNLPMQKGVGYSAPVDNTPPTITVEHGSSKWTNQPEALTVNASDSDSGVQKIQTPDGNWTTGSSATYTAAQNGTYKFVAVDNSGNQSEVDYIVSNIDTAAPSISLASATVGNSNTITATISDGLSGIATQKWASGIQSAGYFANSGTTFAGNTISGLAAGDYTVYACDNAGNTSVEVITIKAVPTIPAIDVSESTTAWTNKPVTLNVGQTSDSSTIQKIQTPDGNWTIGSTAAYQVTKNGTYTFVAVDNAGKTVTKSFTVSNIDTEAPSITVTETQNGDLSYNINVDVDSNTQNVILQKWAKGEQTENYFYNAGTEFKGSLLSNMAAGKYTLFAEDIAGNKTVKAVSIGNYTTGPDSSGNVTDNGTISMTGKVDITGHMSATDISVTHPATANYYIDPNSSTPFSAAPIAVTNNSKVPVNVTVQSLSSTSGGTVQFTDKMPNDENWASLNASDTEKYIALGIGISDKTGWNYGYNSSIDWAASKTAVDVGSLNAGATGNLALSADYGLAWNTACTAQHNLVFQFNLV